MLRGRCRFGVSRRAAGMEDRLCPDLGNADVGRFKALPLEAQPASNARLKRMPVWRIFAECRVCPRRMIPVRTSVDSRRARDNRKSRFFIPREMRGVGGLGHASRSASRVDNLCSPFRCWPRSRGCYQGLREAGQSLQGRARIRWVAVNPVGASSGQAPRTPSAG